MERVIRIGIYRILRRFGASRDEIVPHSKLADLFEIDEVEWNCFMFFLESKFNISVSKNEELTLLTVQDTIDLVKNRLISYPKIHTRKLNFATEVA